jgi:NAD+ kinase
MRFCIYARKIEKKYIDSFLIPFLDFLKQEKIEYFLVDSFANYLSKNAKLSFNSINAEEIEKHKPNYVVCLGGDGTVLDTLRLVRDTEIPVLGINLGRLGFLANIAMEEAFDIVNALKKGETTIEQRTVLEVVSDHQELNEFPFALNDFVVQKRDSSAMITVSAMLNEQFLNHYWADGLIVSTPTGSSGYNLSCGGPFVFPGSDAFVITPIAAHNITVRPAVVPDNNVLRLEIKSRSKHVLVTLDNRSFKVDRDTLLTIKKASFGFAMVQPKGSTYMDTLRNKLHWGKDNRNID